MVILCSLQGFALADCTGGFETAFEKREIELSVAARVVRKLAELAKEVPIAEELIKLIEVEITFVETRSVAKAFCDCLPCCQAPQMQYLGVNFSAAGRINGGSIEWSDVLTATAEGKPGPVDPNRVCPLETNPVEYRANTTVVGIGLEVPVRFRSAQVKLAISATVDCKCTEVPACVGNAPPVVLPFGPVELEYGKETTFTVVARDLDRTPNLRAFFPSKLAGCLTPSLVSQGFDGERRTGWATFRLTYAGEEERIESCVRVGVDDDCGSIGGQKAKVLIYYPPRLTLNKSW